MDSHMKYYQWIRGTNTSDTCPRTMIRTESVCQHKQLQHWNQKKSERRYLMHRLTVQESNQSYCGRQTIQRRSNSHHTTHMVTGALFISRPFSHLPVAHPVKDMYSNCNKPCRAHRPVLRLQRTGPDQRLLDTRCTVSKVIHGRASYCFHRALIRILPILKFISDCNFACQYFLFVVTM